MYERFEFEKIKRYMYRALYMYSRTEHVQSSVHVHESDL